MLTYLDLGNYGRLGNQMWQISSIIGLSKMFDQSYAFPKWKYNNENQFRYPLRPLPNPNQRWRTYIEQTSYFCIPTIDFRYDWNLKGYFQSPKYFEGSKDLITKIFDFGERKQIDYTSIHIRRGDYLSLKHIHLSLIDTDYYDKAINMFPDTEKFIVFSDDIPWCEKYFFNKYSLSRFLVCQEQDEWKAMKFMSECTNHIIANSSYSFWSAYLGINKNRRIIYPSRWVNGETRNDRIPENDPKWEKINI